MGQHNDRNHDPFGGHYTQYRGNCPRNPRSSRASSSSRFQPKRKEGQNRISAICEEAVRLKLAIRQAAGNYKVEVPSRDANWGAWL